MTGGETRAAVVAEAMTWLGTPYRHQASLKDVGCDCLGLVRGVWRAVYGGEPELTPGYTADWAEAKGTETLADAAARYMTAVAVGDALAGDMVLFRWRKGVPAKHCGINVLAGEGTTPRRFIHAQQSAAVALASLTPWWQRRAAFAFRFPVPEA